MPGAAVALSWATAASAAAALAAGGRICAGYLHGSAVLGGWSGHSDVDLLLVAADAVSPQEITAAGQALVTSALSCPGSGLECTIVSASQARRAAPPWPFLLHVATGGERPRIVSGAAQPGDRDLLMHYVVCRAAGHPVLGPPPGELIGAVPRPAVLGYLAEELEWGLDHAPERYAVLNACRALRYLADGGVVSKLAGGEAALRQGLGPPGVIRRALAVQRSGARGPDRAGAEAAAFVRASAARLRDALSPAG